MAKRKIYPVVQLAHWMVKRDGPRCTCQDQKAEVSFVCRDCWGTGFPGGYVLHPGSANYEVIKDDPAPKVSANLVADEWATRVYRAARPFDFTHYAIGDLLVDITDGTRWKVIVADITRGLQTRLIQRYEAAAQFPTGL